MMLRMNSADKSLMLRYAVLWHSDVDDPHFDFLVETRPGSDLATWRLPRWPVLEQMDAIRLKDHRRIYLDYQGELSGHRGRVERIDGGVCQLDIGEAAVWTVSLGDGKPVISFRQLSGDRWMVEPMG